MSDRPAARPIGFRKSGVEVTPEPTETHRFLNRANIGPAARAGERDGRMRIPSTKQHSRYIGIVANDAATALEEIGVWRAEVDGRYLARQEEECQNLSSPELNPSGSARALAQLVGVLSAFVAAALVYVTLEELTTWARVVLATTFGAIFPMVAAWRGLLADVRDSFSAFSAGLVLICSFVLAIDIQSPLPWAMSRVTTTGAAMGILSSSWIMMVIVADAYPPLYRLTAEKRRRDAVEAYMKLTALREAAWTAHTLQAHAVPPMAQALMDAYYAANLDARRNSWDPVIEDIAAMTRPEVALPPWVSEDAPNFDPCSLPPDPFSRE